MRHTIKFSIFGLVTLILVCIICCGKDKNEDNNITVTDIDGNVYNTVTIGTQVWMVENLRTTRYNDGTPIPVVSNYASWASLITPGMCNYNNTTNTDNIIKYGRLYNWYTINTGKIAPLGWHIPSDVEWSVLIDYLGGEYTAGNKLKEAGATHWHGPNTGASNESGFTALPGGYRRGDNGLFNDLGDYGGWWSSSEFNEAFANIMEMYYESGNANNNSSGKTNGMSVRCLQD